jgi:hypothetical protein
MNVGKDHEQDMLNMSDDRKWILLRGEVRMADLLACAISELSCFSPSLFLPLPPPCAGKAEGGHSPRLFRRTASQISGP